MDDTSFDELKTALGNYRKGNYNYGEYYHIDDLLKDISLGKIFVFKGKNY